MKNQAEKLGNAEIEFPEDSFSMMIFLRLRSSSKFLSASSLFLEQVVDLLLKTTSLETGFSKNLVSQPVFKNRLRDRFVGSKS